MFSDNHANVGDAISAHMALTYAKEEYACLQELEQKIIVLNSVCAKQSRIIIDHHALLSNH
jgi:hypothetical protein